MLKIQNTILILLLLSCAVTAPVRAEDLPMAQKSSDTQADAKTRETAPSSYTPGMASTYLSSRFASQNGNVDSAISTLSQALADHPDHPEFATQLLSLQVSRGDINEALKTLATLQSAQQKDPLANILFVAHLIQQQEYNQASKALAERFEINSGQLWLPLVDAWIDIGRKQMKQAITIEEMPVTVGRAAAVMNYHLALINRHAGFAEQAAINFNDALEEEHAPPPRILQQLQSLHFEHPELAKLGDILKRYTDARPEGLPALESPIKSPVDGVSEVFYAMGNVMYLAGVHRDAIIYLQLAHYLRPDFHTANFLLAEVLTAEKDYTRANTMLSAIPTSSLHYLPATLKRTLLLDRMGNATEAFTTLETLAEQHPKNAEIWITKGDLLRVHSRYLEASIAYSEAIRRFTPTTSKDWVAYYARGACYERLGRWNEARADLEKALQISPDQPEVLNYLGYGMLVRGESIDAAKAMLEKALAASPNDPQIIDSMGWALYLLGNYHDALPYLEQATQLLPNDATVNDHLGDVYWRLGRKDEARFQWQRAMTFKPEEEDAKKIQAKLLSGLPETMPMGKTSASATPAAATSSQP